MHVGRWLRERHTVCCAWGSAGSHQLLPAGSFSLGQGSPGGWSMQGGLDLGDIVRLLLSSLTPSGSGALGFRWACRLHQLHQALVSEPPALAAAPSGLWRGDQEGLGGGCEGGAEAALHLSLRQLSLGSLAS